MCLHCLTNHCMRQNYHTNTERVQYLCFHFLNFKQTRFEFSYRYRHAIFFTDAHFSTFYKCHYMHIYIKKLFYKSSLLRNLFFQIFSCMSVSACYYLLIYSSHSCLVHKHWILNLLTAFIQDVYTRNTVFGSVYLLSSSRWSCWVHYCNSLS